MLAPARPEPDELVPVGPGVELAIWREGGGGADDLAPFLLVHGLASNAHLWDGVAARLAAAGHQVVAVDLRGHGRSAKPEGPYDLPTVATDVSTLVSQLGWTGPAVLAGQSYGAIVVLEAANRLGADVKAVACVDGGHIDLRSRFPDWAECERLLAPPRSAGTPADVIEGWITQAHPDWPTEGLAGAMACFEVRADGAVAPWLTFERHMAVLRGLWDADTASIRRATTHPTLLITAEDGMPGKRADLEAASGQLAHADVIWMPGHHDLHAQHPDAVADALLQLA